MDGEKKKFRFSLGYLILAFWAVLLAQQLLSAYMQPARMSYTDFTAAIAAGKVEDVAVGHTLIRGHLAWDRTGETPKGTPEATPRATPEATKATPEATKATPEATKATPEATKA